ncbi:MAG: TIGR02221 family CRISPR-associated protein, partial [Chlorobium sp.]|nr:TIGR02221 family CRISPR-associated protein [Chlorobium sp.]
ILKFLEETASADGPVDRVIFFCTKESRDKHLEELQEELQQQLNNPPAHLVVPEPLVPTEMTAANQWGWFEQLLSNIDKGDTLIIDFTHGMRAGPIVFSSAIGFLQRAKEITLAHALYAWYDPSAKSKTHPIVDMRDFYVINDWAESVARLTDDADARKLAELAKTTGIEALQPLGDPNLIAALQEMTDCIRNVDVNNVSKKVSAALELVEQARGRVSDSAKVMLDLVWEKFSTLAAEYPPSGHYDQAYFRSQLEIVRVLLEHRLFMQAFTAMRELVGSLGMVGLTGKYHKNFGHPKRKMGLSHTGKKRR